MTDSEDSTPPDVTPPSMSGAAPTPSTPRPWRAMVWAWDRYLADPGTYSVAAALWASVLVLAGIGSYVAISLIAWFAFRLGGTRPSAMTGDDSTYSLTVVWLFVAVMSAVLAVAVSCWLRPLFAVAEGEPPRRAGFLRTFALRHLAVAALTYTAASVLLELVLYHYLEAAWIEVICQVLLALVFVWTPLTVADRPLPSALPGIRDGALLAASRPGATVTILLVWVLAIPLGLVAFLMGVVVTVPLAALMTIYYFRALTGRPVAGSVSGETPRNGMMEP